MTLSVQPLRSALDPGAALQRPIRTSLVALLLVFVTIVPVSAQPTPDVVLTGEHRVSIEGHAISLQTLVQDLCWEASIALLAYDAVDRPARVLLDNVPLEVALRRLLHRESFFVEFTTNTETGEKRIRKLRVMGEHENAIANDTPLNPDLVSRPYRLPLGLIRAAFGGDDSRVRSKAFEEITARILADPVEKERFLATPTSVLARPLTHYAESLNMLRLAVGKQKDPQLREKLSAIIAELEGRS